MEINILLLYHYVTTFIYNLQNVIMYEWLPELLQENIIEYTGNINHQNSYSFSIAMGMRKHSSYATFITWIFLITITLGD